MTFRLGSIPVKISASFLILVVLIALQRRTLRETVALVVIIFLSILVHELGHALVAKSYGADPSIEFWFLGGVTRWTIDDMTKRKRLAVTAAGSVFGFIFGGAVWLADQAMGLSEAGFSSEVRFAIFVNVFWGLLNWVPIRSLDGGVMTEILLSMVFPRRYGVIAEGLFLAVAGAALVWAFATGQIFLAVIVAFFGLQGIGSTLERSRYEIDEDNRITLDDARRAMAAGDCSNPLRTSLIEDFESATYRTSALEIMVLWNLRCSDLEAARRLVSSPPERVAVTAMARGSVAYSSDRISEAVRQLTEAVFVEGRGQAVPLLLRAHTRAGTFTEAREAVIRVEAHLLPAADVLQLALRAMDRGAAADARAMAAHLGGASGLPGPVREAAQWLESGTSHLEASLGDTAELSADEAFAVQPIALRAGLPDQAFELGDRVVALAQPTDPMAAGAIYNQACALVALGQVEEALVLLERALRSGRSTVAFSKDDPDLGELRAHPRFAEVWEGATSDA